MHFLIKEVIYNFMFALQLPPLRIQAASKCLISALLGTGNL